MVTTSNLFEKAEYSNPQLILDTGDVQHKRLLCERTSFSAEVCLIFVLRGVGAGFFLGMSYEFS